MNTATPRTAEAPTLDLQLRLQAWLSPAFPIGAFAYSAGLEASVEAGETREAAGLKAWLTCYLNDGPGRSDAALLGLANRFVAARDWTQLSETASLAAALTPSAERRLESRKQGAAFLRAARAAHPWTDQQAQSRTEAILGEAPAYSAAFGAWAGGFDIAPSWAASHYLHATAGNLISAGQRLGLLGQTEGQQLLSTLAPLCETLGHDAASATFDDVGGAMIRGDLASMRHETQNVRLFRS